MFRTHIARTAATVALALVPAAALVTAGPASGAVKHSYTKTVHGICANSATVLKTPGKGLLGNLVKGDTIKVQRVSTSGLYVYGFARGTANKHGWVKSSALCPRADDQDPRIQGSI